MPPTVSVVIPVFNEEQILSTLHQRLSAVLRAYGEAYEIVFVNDGSRDGSLAVLKRLHAEDATVKIVSLSRNFGHQTAITCGLDQATGEAVIVMDADLQDPPELLPQLLDKWRDGYDVVYAVRDKREGESAFKLGTAAVFYRLLRALTQVDIPLDTGDFRLMSRRAVDALQSARERSRFVRGLVSWVGYRQTGVTYTRKERLVGETKYPLRKMLKFALDGLTAFSFAPLQAATYLGIGISALSFLYALYAIFLRLFTAQTVPGWTSLMVAVLFLGGVQLVALGIIGEYLGRVYEEVKQRPLYLLDERIGFESPPCREGE
ncbi:MAG: glycosyltransferase family 2 protein [Deltaproteobacteria bacterium]|nr:glycosyltransferase family 2 protein [Deltaproteobacteria bacterium]